MNLAFEATQSLVIILIIFSVSEIISIFSKGIISKILVATIILIVSFNLGLPKEIFNNSQVYGIGIVLIGFIIVHLGTSLEYVALKKQWKTILIALFSEIGLLIFVGTIGTYLFGKMYALSSISPIGGGIVATLLINNILEEQNFHELIIYTTLLLSFSSFVGYPIATILLKKESKKLLKLYTTNNCNNNKSDIKEQIPKSNKYNTDLIIFTKIAIITLISFYIAKLTNGIINEYVICLLLGFAAKQLKILESEALIKSNSFGFAMIAIFAVLFAKLGTINTNQLIDLLFPIAINLSLGVFGLICFGYIAGRIFKYSIPMTFAISTACLFGFPGTHIITHEVVNGTSEDEKIRQYLLSEMYPKMLIAGFINVSIVSILIANVITHLI